MFALKRVQIWRATGANYAEEGRVAQVVDNWNQNQCLRQNESDSGGQPAQTMPKNRCPDGHLFFGVVLIR